MALTKLITAAQVISIAYPSGLDEAFITDGIILSCQLDWLKDRLTADYYDELISEIEDGGLSDINQAFITDYILNALAYKVKSVAETDIAYKSTNAGVVFNSTDYTNNAGVKGLNDVITKADSLAESWLNSAIRYLKDNEGDFPTFTAATCEKNAGDKFIGGIIFPSNRKRCNCSGRCNCRNY